MKVAALFSVETRELLFVVPLHKWADTRQAFYLAFDPEKIFEQDFESLCTLQEFLAVPTASIYEHGKFTGLIDVDELPFAELLELSEADRASVRAFIRPVDADKRFFVAADKEPGSFGFLSFVYAIDHDLAADREIEQAKFDAGFVQPSIPDSDDTEAQEEIRRQD